MQATFGSPQWADRDRFVLSAGHGSMLLYGLLHLHGYALSWDEVLNFRNVPSFPADALHGPGVFETLRGISEQVLRRLSTGERR